MLPRDFTPDNSVFTVLMEFNLGLSFVAILSLIRVKFLVAVGKYKEILGTGRNSYINLVNLQKPGPTRSLLITGFTLELITEGIHYTI